MELRSSCFELSMHFPVFFFIFFFYRELFLAAVHGWFAIQTNVWKCQNVTRCFLTQLHSSFIFCKIFCIVAKVSNSCIFQKRCFMKIIRHRTSIQTRLDGECGVRSAECGVRSVENEEYGKCGVCGNA